MLNDLAILHRRKPLRLTEPHVSKWETCLRTIAVVKPSHQGQSGDDVFKGAAAYRFLLEIICGLHSPITGETEVMGQFKIFANEWTAADPSRVGLVQRLLMDAKSLRARFLGNLGTQSYGSWLRKNLVAARTHVVGYGHLAQEILPYLGGEVLVHTRRPVDSVVPVFALDARRFDHGALVIAAPLAAAEIARWLEGRRPAQIFDLREDSTTDPVAGAVTLDQIFAQIERNKARLVPVIERVRGEIAVCADRLVALEKVRPQGWDDLCA